MSRDDAPGFGEPTIKYEECYFCDHYVTKERKCALYLFRFCLSFFCGQVEGKSGVVREMET